MPVVASPRTTSSGKHQDRRSPGPHGHAGHFRYPTFIQWTVSMAAAVDGSFPFLHVRGNFSGMSPGCCVRAESRRMDSARPVGVGLATLAVESMAKLLDTRCAGKPGLSSWTHRPSNAWGDTWRGTARDRSGHARPTGRVPSQRDGRAAAPKRNSHRRCGLHAFQRLCRTDSREQYEEHSRGSWRLETDTGVTGFKDAIAEGGCAEAYNALDRSAAEPPRVSCQFIWKRAWIQATKKHLLNIEQRDAFRSERVNPDFIKIYSLTVSRRPQNAYIWNRTNPRSFPPIILVNRCTIRPPWRRMSLTSTPRD